MSTAEQREYVRAELGVMLGPTSIAPPKFVAALAAVLADSGRLERLETALQAIAHHPRTCPQGEQNCLGWAIDKARKALES